jgi:hypothetical protein
MQHVARFLRAGELGHDRVVANVAFVPTMGGWGQPRAFQSRPCEEISGLAAEPTIDWRAHQSEPEQFPNQADPHLIPFANLVEQRERGARHGDEKELTPFLLHAEKKSN